jgi:predicted transcriptional regulator
VSSKGARVSDIFDDDIAPNGTAQRRSKTEMVCDLMLAISKGAVRPTRIMQRANLTWNALLMYLYALASNGLVWREERGSVSLYHLTEKGTQVLEAYLTLRNGLGPLKLEGMDTKTLTDAMKVSSNGVPEEGERLALEERIRNGGYSILPKVVKGKSGVEHEFEVVAKDPRGVVHGFVYSRQPDDKAILGLFVKQLDTGLKVHAVYRAGPGTLATQRAKEYGIDLIRVESLGAVHERNQSVPSQRKDY